MNIPKILTPRRGMEAAKELLYENCNHQTVLFLSGGNTPKPLYETLAKEKILKIGAVSLIDERYTPNSKFKIQNSKTDFTNEKMIKETGLLDYIKQASKFYPVLEGKSQEETTKDFDEILRVLFNSFPKSVGILGIGEDGHIAGIAPNRIGFTNPIFSDKISLAAYFNDRLGDFRQRITQTFLALSKLDLIIVLAIGTKKKQALELMFTNGPVEEVPARFLNQKEISEKTTLITDQLI